jgi:hypothetical protein
MAIATYAPSNVAVVTYLKQNVPALQVPSKLREDEEQNPARVMTTCFTNLSISQPNRTSKEKKVPWSSGSRQIKKRE